MPRLPRITESATGWVRVATVVGVLGLTALAPAPAAMAEQLPSVLAEPPFRLPEQISDDAGVLSGSERSEIQTALAQLQDEDQVQLWVVFVDDFSGRSGIDWAQATFTASNLGSNAVVLAVAPGIREYGYGLADEFALSDSAVQDVMTGSVEPRLSDDDWAGAAIAAADGLRNKVGGSGVGVGTAVAVGGVVVLGGGGYLLYRRSRKKAGTDGTDGAAPGRAGANAGRPGEPVEPYQQLSDRSVSALMASDDAVRQSEFELTAAGDQFGEEATAPFRTAFESARTELTAAFEIRQRIDDEVAESEDERRAMMAQILARCQAADDALDAQTERFEALRDLRSRLPQVLAELPAALAAQRSRLAGAQTLVDTLGRRYSAAAVAAVAGNVPEAQQRLDFAEQSLAQAREPDPPAPAVTPVPAAPAPAVTAVPPVTAPEGIPLPDGSPAPTGAPPSPPPAVDRVLAARAAQESLQQATTLLDAIERADTDLSAAATRLADYRSSVAQELASVRASLAAAPAGPATADLFGRLDQVTAVVDLAGTPAAAADPVTALHKLQEADQALDAILANTTNAQQFQERSAAQLRQALTTAQSEVATAQDYIGTRRGAVQSQARTRIAEAERHLQQAVALADTRTDVALTEAGEASRLAREAIALAQSDRDQFGRAGGGGGGGDMTGAILGGLIGGMLSGGGRRGGGFGGGFGGGGSGGFGGGGGGTRGGGGRF